MTGTKPLQVQRDVGESFEAYVIEELIRASGNATAGFFRAETQPGRGADEVDLVLDFTPRRAAKLAIEVKTGKGSRPRPGFARACALIQPTDQFVVHSGPAPATAAGVPRLDLASAIALVAGVAAG